MNDLARLDRLIVRIGLLVFVFIVACFWPVSPEGRADFTDLVARKQLGIIFEAMRLYTEDSTVPGDLTFVTQVYEPGRSQIDEIVQGRGFRLNSAAIGQPWRSLPPGRWLTEKQDGQRKWRVLKTGKIEVFQSEPAG